MLYVSYICCVYFTLRRTKKPESWLFFGNFGLVIVKSVEIEELVKNGTVDWWITWVFDRLARVDFDDEQRKS